MRARSPSGVGELVRYARAQSLRAIELTRDILTLIGFGADEGDRRTANDAPTSAKYTISRPSQFVGGVLA